MGIIDNELQQIKTAVYGEDMRTAIHDGIKKTYEYIPDAVTEGIGGFSNIALGAYPTEHINDKLASLKDGADDVPVKNLNVDILPEINASGNIVGVSTANITRCGKNLITWPELDKTSHNGISASITSDGKLSLSGTASSDAGGLYASTKENNYSTMHLGPFPAGTYTITSKGFVGNVADDRIVINLRYPNNSSVRSGFRISGLSGAIPTGAGQKVTFTADDKFKMHVYILIKSGTTINSEVSLQMERGSNLGTFEQYKSDIYSFNWLDSVGNIYGGNLDTINGSLLVDRAKLVLGDFSDWSWDSTTQSYTANVSAGMPGLKVGDIICNAFPYIPFSNIGNVNIGISISNSGSSIYVKDNEHSGSSDLSDFILSIQSIEAAFKVSSTSTYQLIPIEVKTYLGDNTIYADCGDIDLVYRADPTLFASKGQTEDDMIANNNITDGSYFQIGSTLYKATSSIATGETIVPGSNCVTTSIAEALNLLNA